MLEGGWATETEALDADQHSAQPVFEEEGFQPLRAGEEELAGLHAPGTCWDSLGNSALLDGPGSCWTSLGGGGNSSSALHAPAAAERSRVGAVRAPAPQRAPERQAAAPAAAAHTSAAARVPLPPLPPIPLNQLRENAKLSRELATLLGHLQAVRGVLPGVPGMIAQLLATAKETEAMLLG